ncbi:MAG: glycosyltransferase family 2 protein [Chloroherpetonaceae bacterium]
MSERASFFPPVAVLLLNWNGRHDTLECLDSLRHLDYPSFQIILCDNGSSDDSVRHFVHWAEQHAVPHRIFSRHAAETATTPVQEKLIIIENHANLGFAGGNNVGLRFALTQNFEYVWLLNTDTTVKPDALTKLIAEVESDPNIGMCGSTLLYYHAPDTIQTLCGGTINRRTGEPHHIGAFQKFQQPISQADVLKQVDYVMGASMLVSRSLLEEVGLMEEQYFLYYEEIDWAERAKGKFKLGYAPLSIVYHKEGRSVGNQPKQYSNTSVYYMTRSRVKFMRKFFPRTLPIVYARLLLFVVGQCARGNWRSATAAVKGLMEA